MAQLPILSGKETVKVLAKLGYMIVRQRGSHMRLSCPARKSITVPNYKTIDRGLLFKIIRDAELSTEEFIELI